jgi:hypothetical protein
MHPGRFEIEGLIKGERWALRKHFLKLFLEKGLQIFGFFLGFLRWR